MTLCRKNISIYDMLLRLDPMLLFVS